MYLRLQDADSEADADVAKNSEITCISYAEVCIMKKLNHAISSSASWAIINFKNTRHKDADSFVAGCIISLSDKLDY